jgi:hypothetical protein
MKTFKDWLNEMLSPVVFPTVSSDRNPYINGKWATAGFQTGKAKVKNNPVRDAETDRKNNTKQDGFHL